MVGITPSLRIDFYRIGEKCGLSRNEIEEYFLEIAENFPDLSKNELLKKTKDHFLENSMIEQEIKDSKYTAKLIEQCDFTIEEVAKEAKRIRNDMNDLISLSGAVMILAKENGIDTNPKKTNKTNKTKKEVKNKMSDLDSFFAELNVQTSEFPDFLKIKNGIVYKLKLKDPSKKPRAYTDRYDNDKWAWDVTLLGVEPEEAKTEYIKNKVYSFSLGKRAMRRFKEFWLANDNAYGTPFTFERKGTGYQTDYEFDILEE